MRLFEMFDLQPFETDEYNTPNQMEIMANPDYWREKKGVVGGVEWMTPTEYIRACEMGFRNSGSHGLVRDGRNPKLVKEYAQAMKQGDIFPMLELDYRKDFFGQEGLHRAMAAELINVKKVPVFIMKDSPEVMGEAAIKLASRSKKDPAVDKFMDTYFKVTQNHPFDPQGRIAWDGKSMATVVPFSDHVNLSAVQTLAPGERSGSANGMVMTLVKIADETGVPVMLTAKPFGNMKGKLTKRQLIAWYKRRGFVVSHGDEMEYVPQEKLSEYKEVVHDTEEGDGNIFGYVVDTDEVQLVNYFVNNHGVSEDIISAIQAKYDTIAIARGMHVDEEYRRQGHGTELMNAFIEEAAESGAQAVLAIADALEDNEFDLVKWYESWGFETVSQTGTGPFMVMEL